MIEELAPGPQLGVRGFQGEARLFAGIQRIAHGVSRREGDMADFRGGDGVDELGGEQCVALDAFVDHEPRGNEAKANGHRADDQQAEQRVPAQQVELLGRLCRRNGVLPLQKNILQSRSHGEDFLSVLFEWVIAQSINSL
ncbi:hypothetical protein D9M70_507570 [compost metagenome]